jgi:site-specific recombinase XerD
VQGQAEITSLIEFPPGHDERYGIAEALNLRDRAIFELLYASGIRVSELTGARCLDLKLKERKLYVDGKGSNGRGPKQRVTPLGRAAILALKAYSREGRPLLKNKDSPYLFVGRGTVRLSRGNYLADREPTM